MASVIGSVGPVLFGIAVFLLGGGLFGTLLGVRAGMELFPIPATGVIMSAYYVGYIAGFYTCPGMVHRVGHIRTFAALASTASAVTLLHAFYVDPVVWTGLRLVTGVCFAGLFMVVESWLNGASTNETRGALLSVYMVVQLSALAVGQLLLNFASPLGYELFAAASVLMSLGLVPVALSRREAPPLAAPVSLGLADLYRTSPLAVIGCLGSGLALGAFWGMGPLFAYKAGLSTSGVAWFMSLGIAGGIVLVWPIGWLSDRHDRRVIITAVAWAIAAVSLLLAGVTGRWLGATFAVVALFGGCAFPLYSLCVAHLNDHLRPGELIAASSGLVLVYGAGAVFGPYLGSLFMSLVEPQGLFLFVGGAAAAVALFALYRMRARAPLPVTEQAEFVALPRTSPAVAELDPRAPPEPLQAAAENPPAEPPAPTNGGDGRPPP